MKYLQKLAGASDVRMTGRGWRRLKKAWSRATPEERKRFGVGEELRKITREDGRRMIYAAKMRRMAALAPRRRKKMSARIGDTFLHVMNMVGIMGGARKMRSLKR